MTAFPHRVVELVGDLDLHTAHRVEARLKDALADGLPVVVDLTDCTFLDVGVVRALARGYERASEEDVGFAVVAPLYASRTACRLLVEAPPEVAPFPVVATRAAAAAYARRRGTAVELGACRSRSELAWRPRRQSALTLVEPTAPRGARGRRPVRGS